MDEKDFEYLRNVAQSDAEPVAATSRSLLRPANQKQTICYCKPSECSAPKPEWCIGRRYVDGFREANAEPVRERAAQVCDDYARRFAIGRPYPQFKEIEVAFKEAAEQIRNITALPRPDASAEIADLQERCAEAQRLAFEWMERHDKVVGYFSRNYPSVMLPNFPFPSPASRPDASAEPRVPVDEIEAAMDRVLERRGFKTTPPDASAGLIEAAEWLEANRTKFGVSRSPVVMSCAKELRARAADRSGK